MEIMANENEIEKKLQSLVKWSYRRIQHDRKTNYGLATKNRSVSAEFPDTEIRCRSSTTAPDVRMRHEELLAAFYDALRGITTDGQFMTLVERRLLHTDRYADLAEELDFLPQSARRKVMLARRHLAEKLADLR